MCNQSVSIKCEKGLNKFNHETLNYGRMIGLILSFISFDDTEKSIDYDAQVIAYQSDGFNGTWFIVFSTWKICYMCKKKTSAIFQVFTSNQFLNGIKRHSCKAGLLYYPASDFLVIWSTVENLPATLSLLSFYFSFSKYLCVEVF